MERLDCTRCKAFIMTTEQAAKVVGRTGHCPHCGALMEVKVLAGSEFYFLEELPDIRKMRAKRKDVQ